MYVDVDLHFYVNYIVCCVYAFSVVEFVLVDLFLFCLRVAECLGSCGFDLFDFCYVYAMWNV